MFFTDLTFVMYLILTSFSNLHFNTLVLPLYKMYLTSWIILILPPSNRTLHQRKYCKFVIWYLVSKSELKRLSQKTVKTTLLSKYLPEKKPTIYSNHKSIINEIDNPSNSAGTLSPTLTTPRKSKSQIQVRQT